MNVCMVAFCEVVLQAVIAAGVVETSGAEYVAYPLPPPPGGYFVLE